MKQNEALELLEKRLIRRIEFLENYIIEQDQEWAYKVRSIFKIIRDEYERSKQLLQGQEDE